MIARDYRLIAKIIASIEDDKTRWLVSDKFADGLFTPTNNFNVHKFLIACKGDREDILLEGTIPPVSNKKLKLGQL